MLSTSHFTENVSVCGNTLMLSTRWASLLPEGIFASINIPLQHLKNLTRSRGYGASTAANVLTY